MVGLQDYYGSKEVREQIFIGQMGTTADTMYQSNRNNRSGNMQKGGAEEQNENKLFTGLKGAIAR